MNFFSLPNFSFNIITSEFFLTTVLLIILVFCVFLLNISETSEIFNNKIIFPIICYSLMFAFGQKYVSQATSLIILNGILIYDELTQFTHLILILSLIIYFLIQKTSIFETKMYNFEIYILILMSFIGMLFLCATYNLLVLYLAIELQSLSFYILAASKKKSPISAEAALKYFILGAIGSGLILYGISVIYGVTGSLNFGNIFLLLNHVNEFEYVSFLTAFFYGLLFVSTGLIFKLGAAPFHMWLPDVYEGSANHITAFFTIMPKITLISLLIRIFFDISYNFHEFFSVFFIFCSICSIFIGSFVALQQKKIKRLLAYSSISHIGFILIGFVVNIATSIEFIFFYLIVYIIMTFNIWSILLSNQTPKTPFKFLTSFTNFSKINPTLSFLIILNLFSLAGIPPLAGFFSKAFIIGLAINQSFYGLAFFAVLCSIISAFYYLRFIKIIYFDKKTTIIATKPIVKIQSIVISITSHFICLISFFPNYLLVYLNKLTFFFLL